MGVTSSALLLIQEVQIAQNCLPKYPICPSFPGWKWKCSICCSDFPLTYKGGRHLEQREMASLAYPQEKESRSSVHKQRSEDQWVRREKPANTFVMGYNSSGSNAAIYWGSRQAKLLHLEIWGLEREYFLQHTVL